MRGQRAQCSLWLRRFYSSLSWLPAVAQIKAETKSSYGCAIEVIREADTRPRRNRPRVLVKPKTKPPTQIARGARLSFRKPPMMGARVRAKPQPSQYTDM